MTKLFTHTLCLFLLGCSLPLQAREPIQLSDEVLTALKDTLQNRARMISPKPLNYCDTLQVRYSAATYDSLIAHWHAKTLNETQDQFVAHYIDLDSENYRETTAGAIPDSVYRARLARIVSPIQLPFNAEVRKYIAAYTSSHRGITQRMLGEGKYYFPIFEEELARQGMPLELKFLPVIESALRPSAVSRAGATGLWQFMLATGRQYGLEVTTMVDLRNDTEAATRAACAFLKDLYQIYGDWTLALAAYNCGPGNVNKALQRAGSNARTFWDIYQYLPRETRNYVPAFVGVTYAYHYAAEHGISGAEPTVPLLTDTLEIHRNLHLEQVSYTLNIPLELVKILNPQYRLDIVPGASKPYPLTLPQQEVCRFIANEEAIYGCDTIYLARHLRKDFDIAPEKMATTPLTDAAVKIQTYKVKNGDTLGSIAKKHGTTVAKLMRWNNMTQATAHKLRIGQLIKVTGP